MSSLNQQALEEYNLLIQETKEKVLEQLGKSQIIFEKYKNKLTIEDNISRKLDFQNFLISSISPQEKITVKEEFLRKHESAIKERFGAFLSFDNETKEFIVTFDSETRKLIFDRNILRSNVITQLTEIHEILLTIYERDIEKLQQELKHKSKQFSELEKVYLEVLQSSKKQQEEVEEFHHILGEENTKLKGLIMELVECSKKGSKDDLNKLISTLDTNISEFDSRLNRHISSNLKPSSKSINQDSQNEHQFNRNRNDDSVDELSNSFKHLNRNESEATGQSRNLLTDFDNVLGDEFKRVEGYYKKDRLTYKKLNVRKSVSRKKDVEKNYVEWRPRASWISTLRSGSDPKKESSSINTEASKERIRNSIKNILTITDKKERSNNTRLNTEDLNTGTIRSNEIVNTDNFWKASNRSISPSTTGNVPKAIQKNINLQEKIKETVEKKMRKLLFNNKK